MQQRNHEIVRATTCLLSRNKGIPVSSTISANGTHALGTEEALFGMGIVGARGNGQAFARIGIYGYDHSGSLRLRFPVDFDMNSGTVREKTSKTGRSANEAERALVNWVQAGLFNVDLATGSYYFKLDRINQTGETATDPLTQAMTDTVRKEFPDRHFFGQPQALEDSVSMFEKYLERQEVSPDGLQAVETTDLLSPEAIDNSDPAVEVTAVEPGLFRSMAISRFSGGLLRDQPNFADLRKSYIFALKQADRMMESQAPIHLIRSTMASSFAALKDRSMENMAVFKSQVEKISRNIQEVGDALKALRAYYIHRTETGAVKMLKLRSGVDKAGLPVSMFSVARGVPMQVISKLRFNGDFPYEADSIFHPEAIEA